MAATLSQIEAALDGVWPALWTATPLANVAFCNTEFDTSALPPGSYWMEAAASAGATRVIGVGLYTIGWPRYMVTAHIPLGQQRAIALGLLDSAVAMFQGRVITAGTSTMVLMSVSSPVDTPRDGWFNLTIDMGFRLF